MSMRRREAPRAAHQGASQAMSWMDGAFMDYDALSIVIVIVIATEMICALSPLITPGHRHTTCSFNVCDTKR